MVKLPEKHPIIKDIEAMQRETGSNDHDLIFGATAVLFLEKAKQTFPQRKRENAALQDEQLNTILRSKYQDAKNILYDLCASQDKRTQETLSQFYESIIDDPSVAEHPFFDNQNSRPEKLQYVKHNIQQAPIEFISAILNTHYKHFEAAHSKYQERVKGYQQDFLAQAEPFFSSYSDVIDKDTVQQRLDTIDSRLLDPVLLAATQLDEHNDDALVAAWNPLSREIVTKIDFRTFMPELFSEKEVAHALELEKISYHHELVHAVIGGRQKRLTITGTEQETKEIAELAKSHTFNPDDDFDRFYETSADTEVSTQKTGFSFHISDQRSRFSWVDEAVTEMIRDKIFHLTPDDITGYKKERKLLKILKKGANIEDDLFIRAYAESESQYTREVLKKIRERYGNGFMVRIDKEIQEKGIQSVLERLQNE